MTLISLDRVSFIGIHIVTPWQSLIDATVPSSAKPIPPTKPTEEDRLIRAFDWSRGSQIMALPTSEIQNDLILMGVSLTVYGYHSLVQVIES